MNRERNALKAGLFIVFSFVLVIVVIVLIRGEGAGATQVRTVTFSLADDLDGLSVGDDVRVGGTKVGSVREVEFVGLDSATPKIVVKFSIPAKYVLRENAEIGVQSSLTGSPDLNITSLGTKQPLAEGMTLVGLPDGKKALVTTLQRTAPHLEEIAKKFETETLPQLNDTVKSANALVKHVDSQVDPVVKQYDGVAQKTGEVMANVRDLVGDSKTDLRGTVKNLNVATASMRDKLPPLMDKITAVVDKVDGAITSARAALADVEKTAANTRDLTASARSILVDNRSKIDNMVKSLKTTSDNLKATSVEVRHSPWRLLYKPEPGEMANLNLYDTAREFAEGAASMSDAAAALRDAAHDPNIDKAQMQKLVEHLDDSFKNFHAAENKLWTSVKQ